MWGEDGIGEKLGMVPQPVNMSVSLYPHQLRAVHMMEEREHCQDSTHENFSIHTNVGVYADLAGYGKTLAILTLILRDKMSWNMKEPYLLSSISNIYGNGSIIKKSLLRFQKIKTTLIIAGSSILKQWVEEIQKTPLVYTIISRKKLESLDPGMYDIVMCAPNHYNYLVAKFPGYAWKRFVYDEPTQNRIPAMRFMVAGFLWFVTATPFQLLYQNHSNHNFLCSLFSTTMDFHIFQSLIVKNQDEYIRSSFSLPPLFRHSHECHHPLYNIVQNIMSDSICRMIEAGNIEKAIMHLGGTTTSNIFELIRNEKEELIREADFKMEKFERLNDEARRNKWKSRKESLEKELEELYRRYNQFVFQDQCMICMQMIDHHVLISCCQVVFCARCILRWLQTKNSCPNCRGLITTDMMHYLRDTEKHMLMEKNKIQPLTSSTVIPRKKKGKADIILDIIDNDPSGKFIIFSNFDETFHHIRYALEDEGIRYAEISGTMESRYKKIHDFKQGELNVLFINSLANGAGINLQEATHVILFHRMEEAIETQIIARAYRIGRTKALHVHHLL